MTRVYADARVGALSSADATKLVFVLVSLVNTIRDNELEQRIERLEEANEAEFKKSHPTT